MGRIRNQYLLINQRSNIKRNTIVSLASLQCLYGVLFHMMIKLDFRNIRITPRHIRRFLVQFFQTKRTVATQLRQYFSLVWQVIVSRQVCLSSNHDTHTVCYRPCLAQKCVTWYRHI